MLMYKKDRQKEQILKGVIAAGGLMIFGAACALLEMRDETMAILKDRCDQQSKNINDIYAKLYKIEDKYMEIKNKLSDK